MEKITFNELKLFIEQLGYRLLNREYKNNRQKLTIVDMLGYYYYTSLFNLKNNVKFNTHPQAFSIGNPYTIQNIKLWCKLNNKSFKLVSDIYENNNKKLKWKCLRDGCEEIFEATWRNIQTGWGCGFCRGFQVGISNCLATKNPELAKEWHPTKNGELTPYDVTRGSKKEIWWICDKGHEWKATINNRNIHNSGCPYCSGRLPSENYNLLIINPKLCEEWNYDKNSKRPEEYCPNSNDYVWWICKECGHEWFAVINNRNSLNSGCPFCNNSHGEKRIRDYFIYENIIFIFQYKTSKCKNKNVLPFDFYIPSLKTCIEYQGIQHYEPIEYFGGEEMFELRLINDNIKRQFCENNNINLIIIPYWDFDNIEEILNKHLKEAS